MKKAVIIAGLTVLFIAGLVAMPYLSVRGKTEAYHKKDPSYEELPEFVRKIEDIPDDARFILRFHDRAYLVSDEQIFREKYGDRAKKVEKLQIGPSKKSDPPTYRVADEEERDIVFKAKEDLEYTDIYIAEAAPAGDSFYLEFFWDDGELEMHVSLANNGMMIESVKNGEKWQVTCVLFNAPYAKAACELFESQYEN